MDYSLLFSHTIPNNDRKRYKQAYIGYSWIVVIFPNIVPFLRDRAFRIGWFIVASQMVSLLISFFLFFLYCLYLSRGDAYFAIMRVIRYGQLPFYFSYFIPCLTWGFFYNKLHIQHLLREGYIPEDEYTKKILRQYDIQFSEE